MRSMMNFGIGDFFDGILDWFVSILDNIPKAIYFFFASFASAIDALQALLRKLAGLDTYWGATGEARTGQDPLTEFVYGILGIGESATAYKALNTVFWSLSIFALIMLALSTMIAMIKSHYSEELQNTNPWKYIYAAIKAVLTYAIMPVIVVIGLQLSSFILRTLDGITAGSDEQKIVAMYGNDVVSNALRNDDGKYTHYDFFGAGAATNTQTFSGMLFKASAYSCNRVRSGDVSKEQITSVKVGSTTFFGNSSCTAYQQLGTSTGDQVFYLADQVDFAFANNLQINGSISFSSLKSDLDVRYSRSTDFIGGFRGDMSKFSKFDVTAVWFFYNLWTFNFILGFGGGTTVVGIMLSIIIGMMSRLIFGAALFLIYPTVVSLAPLDNFNAFKTWGKKFLGQVLMAYGSILGMNILMLILPHVQNISWFGKSTAFGVIDAIINMIVMIVGLLMTKDFINTIGGFIGAESAIDKGDSLKGQVAGTVAKGFTKTAMIGGSVIRAGAAVGKAGIKYGFKGIRAARHRYDIKHAGISAAEAEVNNQMGGVRNMVSNNGKFVDENGKFAKADQKTKDAYKAYEEAKKAGKSDEEAEAAAKESLRQRMKDTQSKVSDGKGGFLNQYDAINKQDLDSKKSVKKQSGKERFSSAINDGVDSDTYKVYKSANKMAKKNLKEAKRAQRVAEYTEQAKDGKLKGYRVDESGKIERIKAKERFNKFREEHGIEWRGENGIAAKIGKGIDGMKIGRQMGDAFLKAIKGVSEGTGVDKMIAGLKSTLPGALTMKDSPLKPVPEGDALQRKNAADAAARDTAQTNALKEILSTLKQQNTTNQQIIASNKSIKDAIDKGNLGKNYTSGDGKGSNK